MNKKITKCRVCQKEELISIINFGNQYLSDFPDKIDKKLPRCPLELIFCIKCSLLQLAHDPNYDYHKQYWYVSGINQTMKDDLEDVVKKSVKEVNLKENDIVVDIGSNDSTLLRCYSDKLTRVGFEPAKNLMEMAKFDGIVINDYFNYKAFEERFGNKKAKIITAIAMFYDLTDPNTFVKNMVKMLDDDGIIVIQLNYLPTMTKRLTFDNVSHEHLEYYSLTSLKNLFDRHNLDIFNAEFNDVNGGSIRIYIGKKDKRQISLITASVLKLEKKEGYDTLEPYSKFSKESKKKRTEIKNLVKRLVDKGKTIYIYGASTRGNALLQACGINNKLVKKAADRNSMKWGKYMVGSWIPVVSEEEARRDGPNYFLVLPWQFKKEFVEREQEYLKGGGKFIFAFPFLEIYEHNGKNKKGIK